MAEGTPKQNPEGNPDEIKKERIPLSHFFTPTEEWQRKAQEFFDTYILPRLTSEQEKDLQRYFEGDKELWKRYMRVADKIEKTTAEVILPGLGIAGGYILGQTIFTTGQVLKYSLLGWTLDANGVPRKDAAALKAFDDTYKATKERGIIGGLASGMGIAG